MIFQHNNLNIENSVYAIINDVLVEPSNTELELLKQKTLNDILSTDIGLLANGAINQGYVEILKEFGQDKLVPAGINVVKLIKDRHKFPTINTAVDAYNVVVAKSLLAIGVHDLDKIIGEIKFNYAHKGEKIPAVNMKNDYFVNEGDYVYRDSEKILAWMDVRDTDLAKITNDTKNILLVIEGNRNTTLEYNLSYLREACDLITQFCGGKYVIKKLVGDEILASTEIE